MGCAERGHRSMAYRDRGMNDSGTLIVAAAPLGQPADASPRLASALAAAGIIAAEDTRRALRLARELGVKISGRLVSYHNAVDQDRVAELLSAMEAGTDVLLIADAGMPGVSDPGFRLVGAAADAGITVTVLPGPSAVTAALAVSGLPTDRFCFEGFPPRGAGPRERRFRELTKTHEEVARGTLAELAAWAERGVLGEITLVVAGAPAKAAPRPGEPGWAASVAEAVAAVSAREAGGMPRKTAIAAVAAESGLPRREVYN